MADEELYVPLVFEPPLATERSLRWVGAVGRLAANKTLAAAQDQMTVLSLRLAKEYPNEDAGNKVRLQPIEEAYVEDVHTATGTVRRRGIRTPHRMCQYSEPVVGTRDCETKGDGNPDGIGGRQAQTRCAAAHRERGFIDFGRFGCACSRFCRQPPIDQMPRLSLSDRPQDSDSAPEAGKGVCSCEIR